MENKHEILCALVLTLKKTRAYKHLVDMSLEETSAGEYVECKFRGMPTFKIDVTADSGIAMIRDIVSKLEEYI